MFKCEVYKLALPKANNVKEAIKVYGKYYSDKEQIEFGVLAVHIKYIKTKN